MNRKILFRGKRMDNGEWETGSLVVLWEGTSCEHVYIADKVTGYHAPVAPSTVGQSTGLTDRNGKRIFEGDIVEASDYTAEDGYGEIIWDGDDAKYAILGCNGNTLMTDFDNYYGRELEVIGNIHDNPELVGGAEHGRTD